MRPGVRCVGANATITQGDGVDLTILINFSTYSAHGASLKWLTLDGNRANNADDVNSFVVYGGSANDHRGIGLCSKKMQQAIYGTSLMGSDPGFENNRVENAHVAGIAILPSTANTPTEATIKDNIMIKPLGQHPIMVSKSDGNHISGNRIWATLVGGGKRPDDC